jgi:ferredoxin
MDKQLRSQVVFHLTGRRADGEEVPGAVGGMRPALMASYRKLEELRYDFPVVFTVAADAYVRSLSSIVESALRAVAPEGVAGEALRRRGLRVERDIRRRVSAGEHGTLSQLWDRAAAAVAPAGDVAFLRDTGEIRKAIESDGEVADCGAALPARFLRHAWSAVQRQKATAALERIGNLVIRLENILRADFARSEAALAAPVLQATFGGAHREMFDFDAMSRLLARGRARGGLGERRRRRVEEALAELRSQRFFAAPGQSGDAGFHGFEFGTADAAMAAFRERLPELAGLLKALRVAELEVAGDYVQDVHDSVFGSFDAASVTPEDLEFFPDYLVCLEAGQPGTQGSLAAALSSGVPLKIMVHVDDVFEEAGLGQGHFAFGMRGSQLAGAAMSFDNVFVLQTSASNLLQLHERVKRGLCFAGPALFSVYSAPDGGPLPGYLRAAGAMQGRAFPAFSYDPGAGPDLAARFSLENNPQPELDWPVERLDYADQDLQAVSEEVAFTFADFALCDPRQAEHFEPAPRAAWGDAMVGAADWMARPTRDPGLVPFVLAVDDADQLVRLVVDERLMRSALRCREAWHRLQELAGIRDSRAERLLAREREAWEAAHQREQAAAAAAAVAAAPETPAPAVASNAETAAASVAEAEPERNPDEPYIETVRCSTCNECTQLNPRMFAYNDNKQAYIADLKAGTYKQLVEAAESCQVSVIHPGKPWDPSEPGLEELMERAKPFL